MADDFIALCAAFPLVADAPQEGLAFAAPCGVMKRGCYKVVVLDFACALSTICIVVRTVSTNNSLARCTFEALICDTPQELSAIIAPGGVLESRKAEVVPVQMDVVFMNLAFALKT